jgi:hypothetical protein
MCAAPAFHRVHETILVLYPNEDILIANGKKIHVKLLARVELLKNGAPYIPLPPSPVITCWGTWLYAIVHYAENF